MNESVADALARVHPEAAIRERLAAFAKLLLEHNQLVNLTAARDATAVAAQIEDSLSVLPYVRGLLVDVGSGGGFPGLPVAIAAGVPVTLIESVAKKARFLRAAVAELGLTVRVVCARAEEAAHEPELRERFASATARALGSAAEVLELTVPFLAVGGVAVLQRGAFSDAERRAAIEAAYTLGAELTAELPLGRKEPNDEGRRIVLATKCDRTPAGFPRRSGLPRRRPLGSPSRKVRPAAS